MEQLYQHQRRDYLLKSLLQFKIDKQMYGETQIQYIRISQNQIENFTSEAQIKQFDCQQIQNYYSRIKLQESIFCIYNPRKKALFLCCSEYCDNYAIMCDKQTCKCALVHRKCNFISIKSFIYQIARKTQHPIREQIEIYFQAKLIIYKHMANRISQERQALMDWQKDIHNDSALFLYIFNADQAIVCCAPKVTNSNSQKINHQKCCVPLQINKKQINEDKELIIKEICKQIDKKYSSMIDYLNQKVDQLYYHKKYANLNSAEFIFIDLLKNMNIFIEEPETLQKKLNSDEGWKQILSGRVIYLSRKQNRKQFKNVDLEKFCLNRIRKKWKRYSQKIFGQLVEGKAMNELFYQMGKLKMQKIFSAQEIRSQIDKIIQSISQGQEYLFSNSILTKKLPLKNLQEKQLCTKLKQYKKKEVCDSNKKKKLLRFRDVKFDQVCISNDRLDTALNNIETIKELGNLRNVTKLQINWCTQMKAQVSIEILNTMPHLKQLSLLNHCQKFFNNFMSKLCQFKQLTFFYINSNSHPEYFRSFSEDEQFIKLQSLDKNNLPSIKELVELSKLPKLENIEISLAYENSAQVIKNMKQLRHLTLGYDWDTQNKIDDGLMKQLCEQRALITLSLIGVIVQSKQVDHIIKSNPHLKTIIIRNQNNNAIINDETVQCMANIIRLQNLCITCNRAITGKHLSKLDNLIMLEIRECRNIRKKEMQEALTKMHKLQHLSIIANKWFDDEAVASVQSCKQLAYLNINSTSISQKGLKHLEGLTRLNILICGFTNIKGKNLIELTKQTTRITRLSIYKLEVDSNELLQISANCQALTHLNIRLTNIAVEALLKIKQLKVVYSSLDYRSKSKLREAGIETY